MQQNREYTTFGKNVGYVIAANIITVLLGLVQIPIITKALGAGLYGVNALIAVSVALLSPFAMLGFTSSIIRFLAAEKDIKRVREDFFSACALVFVSGTVFSLVIFLLADILAAAVLKDVSLAYYIRLGSVLVLLNSLTQVLLAFFRMRRRMGLFTTLNVSQDILQLGLYIPVLLLGYKLTGVLTVLITTGILFVLIALFIIIRQIGFQWPRFSNMKAYLKWGVPLTPNGAILWIINVSDRYMVSYFLGVAAAGVYSASYRIGQYSSFTMGPLGLVLYPTLSKTYDEGNVAETQKYFKYSFKYLMMIAIPSAFGLSLLAKPLLQILTTPEFVAGSAVVPWVAAGVVIFCFYQLGAYIMYLMRKTRIAVWLLGTAAVLNVVLNLILIPRMGVIGAAMATVVAYGVLGVMTLMVTRRYLKFDLSLPFLGKSVLAAGVMALGIRLLAPHSIPMVITAIIGGAAVYFGVLLAVRGLSKTELRFFVNFARNAVSRGKRKSPAASKAKPADGK